MQMSPEVAQELDGACKCCMILRTSAHSGYPHLQDDFVAWWLGVAKCGPGSGVGYWIGRLPQPAPWDGGRRGDPDAPSRAGRRRGADGTSSANGRRARAVQEPVPPRRRGLDYCLRRFGRASARLQRPPPSGAAADPSPAGSSMPSTWRPPTREELEAGVDEAEAFNDLARTTDARSRSWILWSPSLARAVRSDGRDRRAASHAERARLNVTQAIRAAMVNLARENPSLGRHLAATIQTSRYCSYTPDPHTQSPRIADQAHQHPSLNNRAPRLNTPRSRQRIY